MSMNILANICENQRESGWDITEETTCCRHCQLYTMRIDYQGICVSEWVVIYRAVNSRVEFREKFSWDLNFRIRHPRCICITDKQERSSL